jgi:hypothetical protein
MCFKLYRVSTLGSRKHNNRKAVQVVILSVNKNMYVMQFNILPKGRQTIDSRMFIGDKEVDMISLIYVYSVSAWEYEKLHEAGCVLTS